MARSITEALRQGVAIRVPRPALASDPDGPLVPSAAPAGGEARCVVCVAQHLLEAADVSGANAVREAARRLEIECPTCLARPGGGQ